MDKIGGRQYKQVKQVKQSQAQVPVRSGPDLAFYLQSVVEGNQGGCKNSNEEKIPSRDFPEKILQVFDECIHGLDGKAQRESIKFFRSWISFYRAGLSG